MLVFDAVRVYVERNRVFHIEGKRTSDRVADKGNVQRVLSLCRGARENEGGGTSFARNGNSYIVSAIACGHALRDLLFVNHGRDMCGHRLFDFIPIGVEICGNFVKVGKLFDLCTRACLQEVKRFVGPSVRAVGLHRETGKAGAGKCGFNPEGLAAMIGMQALFVFAVVGAERPFQKAVGNAFASFLGIHRENDFLAASVGHGGLARGAFQISVHRFLSFA